MNYIDIANGIVFDKMSIKNVSFDDRLICQKKIYLLQSLGTDLGYKFNWYIRGPYSPSLANYTFANLDMLNNLDYKAYKLSSKVDHNISVVNDLKNEKGADFSQDTVWYELLASLLYIVNNQDSWKIQKNKKELFNTLIELKPQYNKEQCSVAFDSLVRHGFCDNWDK